MIRQSQTMTKKRDYVNLVPQPGEYVIAQTWNPKGFWMNLQIGTERDVVKWLRAHGFKVSEIIKIVWDLPSGITGSHRKLVLNPFGALGLHVTKNPAGTFSYVGSIPTALASKVKAKTADVTGGRAFFAEDEDPDLKGTQRGREILTWKFPVFKTRSAAVKFAGARGFKVATPARNPARRISTIKKTPRKSRKQYQYRAKVSRGSGRKSVDFWAVSDRVASGYCAGLLMQRLPKGSMVTSLQRTGKTRFGPAKAQKKK